MRIVNCDARGRRRASLRIVQSLARLSAYSAGEQTMLRLAFGINCSQLLAFSLGSRFEAIPAVPHRCVDVADLGKASAKVRSRTAQTGAVVTAS